jgi:hypothetical protein
VSRRSLLLLPTLLAAIALPVAPALAGEDPGDGSDSGSATLDVSQGCVSGHRAKVAVTAPGASRVVFFLDGRRLKTVTPSSSGRAVISMRCSRLSVGAHRGRAVVSTAGSTQTLRFQITRARLTSPQFTG